MADSSLSSPSSENSCFSSQQYALISMKKMFDYFSKDQLTDVVLIAGSTRISTHRLVLSAASEYFAAMFTNNLRESKQNEVELKNVNEHVLLTLVHYCYTGTINLLKDTVEIVFGTASLLQFNEVVKACCEFMEKNLHPSNCIGVKHFAESHGCMDLMKVSHNYTMEHFLEVVKHKEFLMLSSDKFEKLLASDDINVSSEEDVFYAFIVWLKHDLINRTSEIGRLFCFIKLPLLSPSFIVKSMESVPLIQDNEVCKELIMEAFMYHLLPERRAWLQSTRTLPRKSTLGDLYAVGGNQVKNITLSIEKYDARKDKWSFPMNTIFNQLEYGIAVENEKMYIIGGRNNLKTLKKFACYDFKKKTWTNLPDMLTARRCLGVAVLEGPVYVVGGHDGWSYLSSVERWDSKTLRWKYVAPMQTERSTLGVGVLNGKLYAVGGRVGKCCLKTVECYDPYTDSWSFCASMIKSRGYVGVGILDGYLYAVGGCEVPNLISSAIKLNSVERYDPNSNTWSLVASMSTCRDAVGVCPLGGRLFAVGGYDGKNYLKLVETYDQKENKWTKVTPLNEEKAATCVVVIKNRMDVSTEILNF